MDRILEIAKAVGAAVVAAAATAIADVDWGGVVSAALASGGVVWATPNKRQRRRRR